MANPSSIERVALKLAGHAPLGEAERAAILALPHAERTVGPSTYLLREGETPKRCPFILSGYVFRQKLTSDGARQIVALLVPGDFIDLQNLFLDESDHSVQALGRATLLDIPREAMQALVHDHPGVARAMWIDSLIEASVLREWVVNIGRRDARARVGHLLCEFAARLTMAGMAGGDGYELPMTQEQLADALGLTAVHVNRVLKGLARDGLIQRDRRNISTPDWAKLAEAADFNRRYLHVGQMPGRD